MGTSEKTHDDVRVHSKQPDGGYGWVIIMCSFILQAISCGISFSVGVFFTEWLSIFQEPHDVTAWVGSLNTGLMFAFGPLASVLVKHLGHRAVCLCGGTVAGVGLLLAANSTQIWHLYVTYGVLGGIGISLIYIPAAVVCSTYFDRLRPLALGVASSGVGLGCLVIPHLLRVIIAHYGWRAAMMGMSALCIQSCLFSFLLIPVEFWQKKKKPIVVTVSKDCDKSQLFESGFVLEPETTRKKISHYISNIFDLQLLGDINFVIFFLNNILWNIGSLILLVMITDYAVSVGMHKSEGTWLPSIVGLAGLTGRISVGVISNLPRVNCLWVYIVSTALTGVAIAIVPLHETFAYFALSCAFYGLFFGAQVGVLAVTITDLFGVKNLAMAYGYIMVSNGLGALLGPPIGGLLFEATQGYHVPFYFAGAISMCAAILASFIPIINRCCKSSRHYIKAEMEMTIHQNCQKNVHNFTLSSTSKC